MVFNQDNSNYDIIGDIHGHGTKLKELLLALGYKNTDNGFQHPNNRKVIFLGDFIDRGEHLKEHRMLLDVVKDMIENNNAYGIMGNHEFNAISFHTFIDNKPLRKHSHRNIVQHQAFLNEFNDHDKWYYLDFFKTLPLFLENDDFRCIHACWDSEYVDYIKNVLPDYKLNDDFLIQSNIEGSQENLAIERLLKGVELELPKDQPILCKDGNYRHKARTRWWLKTPKNIKHLIFDTVNEEIKDLDISYHKNPEYHKKEKPLFIGHYWFQGKPKKIKQNLICLDYSVAKGGRLTSYRYNRFDKKIHNKNFFRS